MKEMRRKGISQDLFEYVKHYLKARSCELGKEIKVGVPQGDPMSMTLFAIYIDQVVRELAEKYDVTAYADDIVIAHDCPVDEVIDNVREKLEMIGLQIQPDKCLSTQRG